MTHSEKQTTSDLRLVLLRKLIQKGTSKSELWKVYSPMENMSETEILAYAAEMIKKLDEEAESNRTEPKSKE